MEPVTTAIVTAVTSTLSKEAFQDIYNTLKAALKKKFGEKSDLVEAVDKLESQPNREDRKATVQEEVKLAEANDDPELVQLAQELLNKLKEQPGGQQVINQTVSNVRSSAFSATGNASVGSVTEHVTPQ
jgi:disulfide oxidoreductase YuzD